MTCCGAELGLSKGDPTLKLERVSGQYDELAKITPLVERADKSAKAVLGQQQILTQVGTALRTINRQSSELLEATETVASLKMQQNAAVAEVATAGQLVMLTQRIGKSANEFLTYEGVSPDAVFLLGKDLNTFRNWRTGCLMAARNCGYPVPGIPQTRQQLNATLKIYEDTRSQASAILGSLQGLVTAREAQATILADSEPLRIAPGELAEQVVATDRSGRRQVSCFCWCCCRSPPSLPLLRSAMSRCARVAHGPPPPSRSSEHPFNHKENAIMTVAHAKAVESVKETRIERAILPFVSSTENVSQSVTNLYDRVAALIVSGEGIIDNNAKYSPFEPHGAVEERLRAGVLHITIATADPKAESKADRHAEMPSGAGKACRWSGFRPLVCASRTICSRRESGSCFGAKHRVIDQSNG